MQGVQPVVVVPSGAAVVVVVVVEVLPVGAAVDAVVLGMVVVCVDGGSDSLRLKATIVVTTPITTTMDTAITTRMTTGPIRTVTNVFEQFMILAGIFQAKV